MLHKHVEVPCNWIQVETRRSFYYGKHDDMVTHVLEVRSRPRVVKYW